MLVELVNVNFHYRRNKPVLKNLSLKIGKNDFVAITGESGCGKSTLLKLIAGLIKPSRGDVFVLGKRVNLFYDLKMSRFRLRNVGLVYQTFELVEDLSVMENILIPVYLAGESVSNYRKRAVELLEYLGLSGFEKARPFELSGGQQQRVALARALIMDPVLILADEPTANLDPENSTRIVELLISQHKEGKSLVFVSHQKEVLNRASELYIMRDGGIEKSR